MAAAGAAAGGDEVDVLSTFSASILGADELRLIFMQLLATREPEKDFGRCLCVSKEWADVLDNTPSLWFKLFSILDPTEAASAAAAAPAAAPGVLAKQGRDTFNDNDYKRRWVEQYCWRKTQLCSRCFVPNGNADIRAWKVRLCSPCIAASILNKTDSSKLFMLTPNDLAPLPTWISGVVGPFGAPVQFFFRRHLERAAAQKHGASGIEAARTKQTEKREKRVQSKVDKQASKEAQLDELLKANGLEAGYNALYQLPQNVAQAIRVFVDVKTAGKKRKGSKPGEPALVITTFEEASAVIRKELTRIKRRKALAEACDLASFSVDSSAMPAVRAAYEAFVTEEDASFDAVLKKASKATPEPAAKKRKTGLSTAKKGKGKRRGRHSSDDDSEDDAEAEAMELSDDDEAVAIVPKSRRRRGSGDGDLSAAALATVRDLMQRERRDAEAFAELKLQLSLAALDLKCRELASPAFFRSTPQFKLMVEKLKEPLPTAAAAIKRATGAASALAASTAQDILSGIVARKSAITAALEAKLQELSDEWGLSPAVMARLLECSVDEAEAVFDFMLIDGKRVSEQFAMSGHSSTDAPPEGVAVPPQQRWMYLESAVSLLMHHLSFKLRIGEMKERATSLFAALRAAAPHAEGEETALSGVIRNMLAAFADKQLAIPYRLPGITDPAALGTLLRSSLSVNKLKTSTSTVDCKDLALVPATGSAVLVAQAPATELGQRLKVAAAALSQIEPVRELFVQWILDGRFDAAADAGDGDQPPPDVASQIAARIVGAADARSELLAAIRGVQSRKAAEPFTLDSAPYELVERLEHFLSTNQFKQLTTDAALTGSEAKTALLAWAADSLRDQERRFVKLEKAFTDAKLDTSGLRKYKVSNRVASFRDIDHPLISMPDALLLFLRGPASAYEQHDPKRWRNNAIRALVQKARASLHLEETRGVRTAAAARESKMQVLRGKLDGLMEKAMRSHAEWSAGEYWAREHAKAQSALAKKFIDDTVKDAFPAFPSAVSAGRAATAAAGAAAAPDAAAGGADAAEAGAGGEAAPFDLDAIAAAAAATPAFDAAIAEMVKLFAAAKGLSYSVLQATRVQERRGRGGFGMYGPYGGGDSDDDDGEMYGWGGGAGMY